MNKLDLLSVLSDIDETYIAEAAPRTAARTGHGRKLWLLSAAASLVLIISAGILFQIYRFDYPDLSGRFPVKYLSPQVMPHSISAFHDPESQSDISYGSNHYVDSGLQIAQEKLGRLIESRSIETSRFGAFPGMAEVGIYQIAGISSQYAIALRESGKSGCFLYFNDGYFPKTLEDWAADLGISDSTAFPGAVYTFKDADGNAKTVVFSDLNETRVYETLLGAEDRVMKPAEVPGGEYLFCILMEIPALGSEKARLYVTEDGFVYAQIGELCGKYRIGRIAAHQLMEEVFASETGYELDLNPTHNS